MYHGYFELVLESLTKNPIAADIIVFGIIMDCFLFYSLLIMVCYVYSLESLHVKENRKDIAIMPADPVL